MCPLARIRAPPLGCERGTRSRAGLVKAPCGASVARARGDSVIYGMRGACFTRARTHGLGYPPCGASVARDCGDSGIYGLREGQGGLA